MDQKLQLAIQHFNSGRLDDAEKITLDVLQDDPTAVVAYHLLGSIELHTNRLQSAVTHLSRAIEIAPNYANAYLDLAKAFRASGRADLAIQSCKRLLLISPSDAMAHYSLGSAFVAKGMFSEAKNAFLESVRLNPGFAGSACDLATALWETGGPLGAEKWYRKAIELNPSMDIAHVGLARSLAYTGNLPGAIRALCAALARLPDSYFLRRSLSEMVNDYPFPETGAEERRILLNLLEDPNIPSQNLAITVASMLSASAGFNEVQRAALAGTDITDALDQADWLEDPLLIAALPKLVFRSAEMEQVFTAIRRACLLSNHLSLPQPFLCALAQNCFVTEYVWQVDEAEEARLSEIIKSISMEVPLDLNALEHNLVKLALYQPLYPFLSTIGDVRTLAEMNWSAPFKNIVESQILNSLDEQKLAEQIPCISDLSDDTSIAVKQQYEDNPYPRWMDCRLPNPGSFAMVAGQWRPGEVVPEMPDPLPVLDAGCGTGHSPVQAARMYHRCRLTAVDLSKKSLGYAARMAQKYRLNNIDFLCGDILTLGVLQERYAIILCSGVLHHLERPVEGWRVLVGLLAEGGLMRISLYSTHARKNVVAARALFADSVSEKPTLKDIQRFRRVVLDLPEDHPAKSLIFSPDFSSASGFRDLALHTREHTFTLPEISEILQELDLRFLGFEHSPEVLGEFKRRYPENQSETDIALWDTFEQEHPTIFAGMYQFWCSK